MQSKHYQAILKRVVTRVWDSLPNRERDIIASDVEQETELARWFNKTVNSEAKSKFESPSYWMNEPESFRYAQFAPDGAE